MKVSMVNPKTGELKEIKVGWSWILFLFSGLLGIPLFLRKLNTWGGIMLALWAVNLILSYQLSGDDALGIGLATSLCMLGLQIYLGIKGNEMTAKNYLESGWVFDDPESQAVKIAKGKWGIVISNNYTL